MPPEVSGFIPEMGRHREDAPPPILARPGEEQQVPGTFLGQTERERRLEKTKKQLARIHHELGLSETGMRTRQPRTESSTTPTQEIVRPAPLPKPDLSKKSQGVFGRLRDALRKN